MHTKTLVGVSVMALLGVLALFAFSAQLKKETTAVADDLVNGEVVNEVEVKSDLTPTTPTTPVVESVPNTERRGMPEMEAETLVGSEKFTGVLQEVNTGCFADGECYVVVGGKHVTTLMGWTNAEVGQVLGVEGFGDLEYFIGETVEVYAGKKSDGTYTLYQDADYYVTLKGATGVSIELGKTTEVADLKITPIKVLEDSRCPIGVMCIQAGTVKVEVLVEKAGKSEKAVFELGKTELIMEQKVTLLRVDPQKEVDVVATEYAFYFGVQ